MLTPGSTQYHAALILLHRPFVRYNETSAPEMGSNRFTSLSRTSCAGSARKIAVIFEQYRSRFDLAQVYGSGVQHAGTAATAAMAEVMLQTDPRARSELIEKLASLRLTISLMSRNYQPAGHMTSVVDQFIRSVQDGGREDNHAAPKLQQQQPQRLTNSESSGIVGGRLNEPVDFNPPPPDLEGLAPPSRKRARVDAAFSFTPTCPGAQSPLGLPFLPSSFLEGLGADDSIFSDLAGIMDGNFQWDYESGPQ